MVIYNIRMRRLSTQRV